MMGMRWLALGDANTNSGGGVRTYVDLARAEAIKLCLASIDVYGDREWTSLDLLRAIAQCRGPIGADGADLVSIMIGTFDHAIDPGQSKPRVTLDQFRENMREVLLTVRGWERLGRRSDGGPTIIVLTPPFCMTGVNKAGVQFSQERLSEYSSALLELAAEQNVIPVDINTIFAGSVRRSDDRLKRVWTEQGDGITLNSIAHKLIYPFIRGALKACVQ